MFKKTLLVVTAIIMALSLEAFCEVRAVGKRTPGANRRQANQMKRIKQGVKSGELTKEEAKGLIKDEKEIQKMKQDARADGVVTAEERKGIRKELNEESKKIYEEKHDAEKK